MVKTIVEGVAREKGVLKKDRVSDGWWRRFLERQPLLLLRTGDATADVRMKCVNPEAISSYFELLKDVLIEHGLKESPGQLYNVDKTCRLIITKRGHKEDALSNIWQ